MSLYYLHKIQLKEIHNYGNGSRARVDSCLDFGSQYNQLITRRIREMGVYSELHDHEISVDEIKRMNPKGIILSGGPNSVYEKVHSLST